MRSLVAKYRVCLMVGIACLGLSASACGAGNAGGSMIARRCVLLSANEIGRILALKGLSGPRYVGKYGCSYTNRDTALAIGISPGTRQKFESIKRRDANDSTSTVHPLGRQFGVGGYYSLQKGRPLAWSFSAWKRNLILLFAAADVPLWRGRNLFSLLYERA